VHGLLGEELQDGGADIAPRRPSATAATVVDRPALGEAGSGTAGVVVSVAGVPAFSHGVHEFLLGAFK
jgi:hypothetical protein